MDDIKIDLPLCDQYNTSHDPAWAYRMCVPCVLWMVLKHHDPSFSLSPQEINQGLIDQGGYLENIGFKHQAMAEFGTRHGLPLEYAKRFFYTPEEKETGMAIINANLRKGDPVITSMYSHFTPARGGHMVVVQGFQEFKGQTIGYYIQSPDATFRGHNYFVTKEEFVTNWRGSLICRNLGRE